MGSSGVSESPAFIATSNSPAPVSRSTWVSASACAVSAARSADGRTRGAQQRVRLMAPRRPIPRSRVFADLQYVRRRDDPEDPKLILDDEVQVGSEDSHTRPHDRTVTNAYRAIRDEVRARKRIQRRREKRRVCPPDLGPLRERAGRDDHKLGGWDGNRRHNQGEVGFDAAWPRGLHGRSKAQHRQRLGTWPAALVPKLQRQRLGPIPGAQKLRLLGSQRGTQRVRGSLRCLAYHAEAGGHRGREGTRDAHPNAHRSSPGIDALAVAEHLRRRLQAQPQAQADTGSHLSNRRPDRRANPRMAALRGQEGAHLSAARVLRQPSGERAVDVETRLVARHPARMRGSKLLASGDHHFKLRDVPKVCPSDSPLEGEVVAFVSVPRLRRGRSFGGRNGKPDEMLIIPIRVQPVSEVACRARKLGDKLRPSSNRGHSARRLVRVRIRLLRQQCDILRQAVCCASNAVQHGSNGAKAEADDPMPQSDAESKPRATSYAGAHAPVKQLEGLGQIRQQRGRRSNHAERSDDPESTADEILGVRLRRLLLQPRHPQTGEIQLLQVDGAPLGRHVNACLLFRGLFGCFSVLTSPNAADEGDEQMYLVENEAFDPDVLRLTPRGRQKQTGPCEDRPDCHRSVKQLRGLGNVCVHLPSVRLGHQGREEAAQPPQHGQIELKVRVRELHFRHLDDRALTLGSGRGTKDPFAACEKPR
eukprot:scaffold8234_cov248-Pinguiococcus_pyrenoidosus.AAC.6